MRRRAGNHFMRVLWHRGQHSTRADVFTHWKHIRHIQWAGAAVASGSIMMWARLYRGRGRICTAGGESVVVFMGLLFADMTLFPVVAHPVGRDQSEFRLSVAGFELPSINLSESHQAPKREV